jgi:murein DD-endopeptidase MepM/ murein hydrolase activator NlpD
MKKYILSIGILAAALQAAPNDAKVILDKREDHGRIILSARNSDPRLQRWIQVRIEQPVNVLVDRGLPLRAMLQPYESRDLAVISPANPQASWSYRLSYGEGFGNPDANPDMGQRYLFPFEHGSKQMVGQGYLGSATHQGLYALDFNMAEGTTICAARDGVVAELKDDSDMGGSSPAFARLGNYIDVLHEDGTWAVYAHLKNRGALVREGDRVRAGDPIGLSGQTGQASGPHLHFSVQKPRWEGDPETFSTPFAVDASRQVYPEEGHYYYSWHPDGAPFTRVDASSVDEAALDAQVKPLSGGKPRFREERIDNTILLFFDNPSSHRLELKVEFASSKDAATSKPLPFVKVVPKKSEVFLFSITLKNGSRYSIQSSLRVADEP